jgi:hypothetical protein
MVARTACGSKFADVAGGVGVPRTTGVEGR